MHGSESGQLNKPYSVAVDLYGFTLVADTSDRESIFDKDGNDTNYFGSEGSALV